MGHTQIQKVILYKRKRLNAGFKGLGYTNYFKLRFGKANLINTHTSKVKISFPNT